MNTEVMIPVKNKLEIKNRMKRIDSIGAPDSPCQILLLNMYENYIQSKHIDTFK